MRGHTARDQVTATMDVEGITLQGSLGVATAADVRALLHTAIDTGSGDLVLHLGEAEVEDATGLGVIVEAHRRARRALPANASGPAAMPTSSRSVILFR